MVHRYAHLSSAHLATHAANLPKLTISERKSDGSCNEGRSRRGLLADGYAQVHDRNSAGLAMMRTPVEVVCHHVMETCDRIDTASFDPSIWNLRGLASVPAPATRSNFRSHTEPTARAVGVRHDSDSGPTWCRLELAPNEVASTPHMKLRGPVSGSPPPPDSRTTASDFWFRCNAVGGQGRVGVICCWLNALACRAHRRVHSIRRTRPAKEMPSRLLAR